jgi:hypothetical protein
MVSRNDHLTKLRDPAKAKPVGIAVIKSEAAGSLSCSCGGWSIIHPRAKVREDRAQKHIDRKHGGRGVWL